uniref:MRN complex-interacting protein isoform X2 n=1 Tax=Pristiophorus japonicus TaxID=55135 RepID=UPI00398E447A
MAQRFQALRCCFCKTYQVQQVYGQGSGADCRQHVQKLNMVQCERMQAMEAAVWSIEESTCSNDGSDARGVSATSEQAERPASSRWSVYLDQRPVEEASEEQGGDREIVYTDRQQFQADRRNSSQDGSKHKRGLQNKSRLLDAYGHCTDSDGEVSAQKKMKSYRKSVNTTPSEGRGGNPEIGDTPRSDVLNQSRLESAPAAGPGEGKQRSKTTFPAKDLGARASRWARFLPRGSPEHHEFFDQDRVSCGPEGHPTRGGDSPPAEQPSARSVLEGRGHCARGSAGLAPAADCWPSAPPNAGSFPPGIVAGPCAADSPEHIEGAALVLGSAARASVARGPSSGARGAVKDVPAGEPPLVPVRGAAGDSRTPTPGPPPIPPSLQRSAGGPPSKAPTFHTKCPSSFLSLFQTDEDFEDL